MATIIVSIDAQGFRAVTSAGLARYARRDDRASANVQAIAARFVTITLIHAFTEELMGSKPSHAQPSNRPESGGTDRDDIREKSGLQERDKQEFARKEAEKRDDAAERSRARHPDAASDDEDNG